MTKEQLEWDGICSSCMQLCSDCAIECEEEGGMDECAWLCRICHVACDRHAKSIRMGDHQHFQSCIASCEACAVECDKFARANDICRRCADSCRKCALICRDVETARLRVTLATGDQD